MKRFGYILSIFLISAVATAELFELGAYDARAQSALIQLSYGAEHGRPFAEAIRDINLEADVVVIRLLGHFSDKTNVELLSYYHKKIPAELQAALGSSGNLHNPALRPLLTHFSAAFKETELYLSIEKELQKAGYQASSVEFEKYTINTKGSPQIWVADIWLAFSK